MVLLHASGSSLPAALRGYHGQTGARQGRPGRGGPHGRRRISPQRGPRSGTALPGGYRAERSAPQPADFSQLQGRPSELLHQPHRHDSWRQAPAGGSFHSPTGAGSLHPGGASPDRETCAWTRRVLGDEDSFRGFRGPWGKLLRRHREDLVLKTATGYGGAEVFVGRALSEAAWNEAVEQAVSRAAEPRGRSPGGPFRPQADDGGERPRGRCNHPGAPGPLRLRPAGDLASLRRCHGGGGLRDFPISRLLRRHYPSLAPAPLFPGQRLDLHCGDCVALLRPTSSGGATPPR